MEEKKTVVLQEFDWVIIVRHLRNVDSIVKSKLLNNDSGVVRIALVDHRTRLERIDNEICQQLGLIINME
jgi:hypothetical protein